MNKLDLARCVLSKIKRQVPSYEATKSEQGYTIGVIRDPQARLFFLIFQQAVLDVYASAYAKHKRKTKVSQQTLDRESKVVELDRQKALIYLEGNNSLEQGNIYELDALGLDTEWVKNQFKKAGLTEII